MTGLVEQLVSDALDQSVPIGTLLRKVKLAAVKLQRDDAIEWVDAELRGYEEGEVPPYRRVHGIVKALSAHHGWQPLANSDAAIVPQMILVTATSPVRVIPAGRFGFAMIGLASPSRQACQT